MGGDGPDAPGLSDPYTYHRFPQPRILAPPQRFSMAHRSPRKKKMPPPPTSAAPVAPLAIDAAVPGAPELAALLDQTSELICATDASGRLGYVNSTWLRALGYERDEVAGKRLLAFVAPRHRRRFLEAARDLRDGGSVSGLETVLRRRDGARVVCRARAVAGLRDHGVAGYHVVLQDVTAQTRAEAIRSRLATALEETSDIVLMSTVHDRLVFVNRAARALLGIRADADPERLSLADYQDPDSHATLMTVAVPAAVRDGVWKGESVLRAADDEMVPVSVALVAHPSTRLGEPPYFLSAVMRDLRERVRAEQQKNRFVATVSHELRTPLTAIRGSADLLNRRYAQQLDDRAQALTSMLLRNTDLLIRIVNDLVDIQRIESGAAVLEPARASVAGLVSDAIELARVRAAEAGIEIEQDVTADEVVADAGRIVQVLTNLLVNAIKFSPHGSTVTIAATPGLDGGVELAVRDEGRGIPAEHLTTIFEPFEQVQREDARGGKGAGLGLAICRAIVTQHGGRIWAESTPGGGSTFRVVLP